MVGLDSSNQYGIRAMNFTSWRGVVGLARPTMRPGSLEELIRLLPEGIGVIPITHDIRDGTEDEFHAAVIAYEKCAARFAEAGVDLIQLSGTPPFMLQGYEGEAKMIRRWERKYKTPIFTAAMNHVNALRAFKITRFAGISYSRFQNDLVVDYMTQAGFDVVAMEPIEVPFSEAGHISPERVYTHAKETFLNARRAQAIYIQGGAWRVLDVVENLEADLGVPVVCSAAALSWEIQKRLHVRQPIAGRGRLLAELP